MAALAQNSPLTCGVPTSPTVGAQDTDSVVSQRRPPD